MSFLESSAYALLQANGVIEVIGKSVSFLSMAPNMKFWDDWVDVEDMEAMWNHPEVREEWLRVGEERGMKVHLSRNFDGKPYVTHTEMKVNTQLSLYQLHCS